MRELLDIGTIYKEAKNGDMGLGHVMVADNVSAEDNDYKTIVFPFSDSLWIRIQSFSTEQDSTLFLTLLTTFRVLLYRYNFEKNIRGLDREGRLFSLQSDPLHPELIGEMCFTKLLKEVQKNLAEVNNESSQVISGETSDNVMFVMEGKADLLNDDFDLHIARRNFDNDLVFAISDSAVSPKCSVTFRRDTYSQHEIQQMLVHYNQLLCSISRDPRQKIGAVSMLSAGEEHKLLRVFNDTAREYDRSQTIVDIFERQVMETPGNTALFLGEDSMTYEELNRSANQLAHYLIALGVQKEDNVCIHATRGFDMIIGLFGILKAGAAYIPLEPEYPTDRKLSILQQSSVKYMLTNVDIQLEDSLHGIQVIDLQDQAYTGYSIDNPGVDIQGSQLAYTIYTSGSTGKPKGVMIEHHSVVNLVGWVNSEFNVGPNDCLLFITSVCFDLSVYDIFGMLATGGSIVIAENKDVLQIAKLEAMLQRYNVTFWDSVPSTMDFIVNRIASDDPGYRQHSLRLVFMSGDWIPVGLPSKLRNHFVNAQVVSLGGATEGTVWSNYYPVRHVSKDWKSIPYGKPITNNAFYILNEGLQPVPYGVVGELYIGGVGVARGYANDPEKTRDAFMPDPFTSQWGGRMYRTGDLGRMLPDNTMEFLGRKDNQVKLLGHRVELSEIECLLRKCESVSSAVVVYNKAKNQLNSYIVPGKGYDREVVINALKSKLPHYMMPAQWIELDQIPLTSNGKIDTKKLLDIRPPETVKESVVEPENELERKMVLVWQDVLGTSGISVTDNFFELGGQSLIAVELITKIEKEISKALPVNILYKHPTIRQLASFVEQQCADKKWKSLIAIKGDGNKMPVYIVPGDGLSLSNFDNLSKYVDADQPIYSLQPIGLDGSEAPLEDISDIARQYIKEILAHNPEGPYALAGYSFGGYVAIEIKKQLEESGRQVKMLAIFDTDAENVKYKKDWLKALPKRITRQIPKFVFIAKSMVTRPLPTISYQYTLLKRKVASICYAVGIKEKPQLTGVHYHINRINETNLKAFRNYQLTSFNDKIYLFKAKYRMYFVDDFEYLGWTNYALKGVSAYEVPGDHKTMFQSPNVQQLAQLLQSALDNC